MCFEADVSHVKRGWQPLWPGAWPEPDFKLQYLRLLTNREGGAWCGFCCDPFFKGMRPGMRKFLQYRKCRNCCRGLRPGTLILRYLVEPSISRAGKEASLRLLLIQLRTAFTGSSFDTIPKGKNIRGGLPGRQPRVAKLDSGLSLQITTISRQPCKAFEA